jgi:general L-amino acid transport system substrate-binding protein
MMANVAATLVRYCIMVATMAAIWINSGSVVSAQTVAAIKARGTLVCGVSEGIAGFSIESNGSWSGFDVDFCRALAIAVLGDIDKVRYVPLTASNRFAAVQRGDVDVLLRNATWTMGREIELKLAFPAVTYFDGQGFLVRRSRNASSALELDGATVCVQSGTTTQPNLEDYFRTNGMKLGLMPFENVADAVRAYDAGRCDVYTSDVSQLYAARLDLGAPDDNVILPDIISKEPLSPVVRQGDDQWFNIVKWTVFALINAEELGVSTRSLDQALKSQKSEIKRLVGTEGSFGEQMGLTNDWASRIIRVLGNYGQIFDRNLGVGSKLGITRGLNHLWTDGGILYAPPIR